MTFYGKLETAMRRPRFHNLVLFLWPSYIRREIRNSNKIPDIPHKTAGTTCSRNNPPGFSVAEIRFLFSCLCCSQYRPSDKKPAYWPRLDGLFQNVFNTTRKLRYSIGFLVGNLKSDVGLTSILILVEREGDTRAFLTISDRR